MTGTIGKKGCEQETDDTSLRFPANCCSGSGHKIEVMESERRVAPGRHRRLAEELVDEQLGALERSSAPEVLVDEVDYAMHPPRHEQRVPTYGAIVLPTRPSIDWTAATGLAITSNPTTDRADDEIRRYADGRVSWTVRTTDGIESLVVFDRAAGSERDLVVLAAATDGMIVQRHGAGGVRLVGSFGVARWDGIGWRHEPPIESWLLQAGTLAGDPVPGVLDHLLRFAIHDLGARAIGTTFILGPDPTLARSVFEHRLAPPPPLRIDRPADLGPLHHVLTQTDGAAVLDRTGTLRHIGVRLIPSLESERSVAALGGTRHTSARRYSADDGAAIVVVVSDDGPVTVFRGGEIIGRSALS